MRFTVETVRRVLNSEGTATEIGPDHSGFGCVEIRSMDAQDIISESIMFPPEEAKHIAQAMLACATEMLCNEIQDRMGP